MRLLLTTAALAALATSAHAEGKLSVYHWFEYIPQELVDKFQKEIPTKFIIRARISASFVGGV